MQNASRCVTLFDFLDIGVSYAAELSLQAQGSHLRPKNTLPSSK
jgi:hypothetical protein